MGLGFLFSILSDSRVVCECPAPGKGEAASQSAAASRGRRAAACLADDDEQEEEGTQDPRHGRKGKGAHRKESKFAYTHVCG